MLHWGFVDPNKQREAPFVCVGPECPLCGAIESLEGEEKRQKAARSLTLFYWEDSNGDARIIEVSESVSEKIHDIWLKYAQSQDAINIFDLNAGRQVKIVRSGLGKETRWSVKIAPTDSAAGPNAVKQLQTLPKLSSLYKKYSVDELRNVLRGVAWKNDGKLSGESQSSVKSLNQAPAAFQADPSPVQELPPQVTEEQDRALEEARLKIFGSSRKSKG